MDYGVPSGSVGSPQGSEIVAQQTYLYSFSTAIRFLGFRRFELVSSIVVFGLESLAFFLVRRAIHSCSTCLICHRCSFVFLLPAHEILLVLFQSAFYCACDQIASSVIDTSCIFSLQVLYYLFIIPLTISVQRFSATHIFSTIVFSISRVRSSHLKLLSSEDSGYKNTLYILSV